MPDLKVLDIPERKKKFIDVLLPTVFLAKELIAQKKEKVEDIKGKKVLSKKDSVFLDDMLTKFNAKDINDLLIRMHTHPASIILAQAAIESAWGISRFCLEADNIFGVWSFSNSDKRIAAGKTRDGKIIYLRKYDSLLESVMNYLYTLARGNAFNMFRKIRTVSDNPYRLIWFLKDYSEERLEYVITLRNMIEYNDLEQYDNYTLTKIKRRDKTWHELLNEY